VALPLPVVHARTGSVLHVKREPWRCNAIITEFVFTITHSMCEINACFMRFKCSTKCYVLMAVVTTVWIWGIDNALTLSHSHALTLSHSHTLTLSRSHALTLHALTLSRSHALTLPHSLTPPTCERSPRVQQTEVAAVAMWLTTSQMLCMADTDR
jgi:hypothetical protein